MALNSSSTIVSIDIFLKDIYRDHTLDGIVKIPRVVTIFNRITHKNVNSELFNARFKNNWAFWKEVLTLSKGLTEKKRVKSIIQALIDFGDLV